MVLNVLESYPLMNDYFNSLREQYSLTKREAAVLQMISITGLSNEEIGKEMRISHKTVRNYITVIKRKMEAKTSRKVQAIVLGKTLPAIFFTAINPETNTRIAK